MKKFVATFAAIAAIGMGSAAMAQSAMSGSAMSGDAMHGDAMHGAMMDQTMVCHASAKGDTPNAKMGTEDISCKKIDFAKAKATFAKMMMSMSSAPTQAQIDAAWDKAFGSSYVSGPGN
jgi:hypothetical protein